MTWDRFAAALAATAMCLVSGTSRGEDWPQWLGSRRDGSTGEKVAAWTADAAPKVVWKKPVGNGFSSPVVAWGKVFVHARSQDSLKEEEEVLAFDAANGELLWSESYVRPKYFSVLGTGPRATPTVAGNHLYTLGINGLLSAYDVANGKRLWQVNLYEHFKAELPRYAVCCSPLVIGNRVIVSVGGKGQCVVALHSETGAVEWQALDDAASTSSAVVFAGGDRPPGGAPDVVFMTPLRLLGLDPLDGAVRWEHPMVFQPQGTSPTPIVVGNMLVASTQAHGAVAVQVKTKDDAPTAASQWQNQGAKSYFSSGVADQERVYLVTNTIDTLPAANLTCVEAKTGMELWTKKDIGYFHAGVLRTGDGKLLVLSDAGTLSLLELAADGAKELCKMKACGGTLVSPALAGGRLYARDGSELVCIELPRP